MTNGLCVCESNCSYATITILQIGIVCLCIRSAPVFIGREKNMTFKSEFVKTRPQQVSLSHNDSFSIFIKRCVIQSWKRCRNSIYPPPNRSLSHRLPLDWCGRPKLRPSLSLFGYSIESSRRSLSSKLITDLDDDRLHLSLSLNVIIIRIYHRYSTRQHEHDEYNCCFCIITNAICDSWTARTHRRSASIVYVKLDSISSSSSTSSATATAAALCHKFKQQQRWWFPASSSSTAVAERVH